MGKGTAMQVIEAHAHPGYSITICRDGATVAEIEQVADSWTLRTLPDEQILFCDSPVEAVRQFYMYAHER